MMVELTLAQAGAGLASAFAYAVIKPALQDAGEPIIPPASIFKRLYKRDTELIYVKWFSPSARLEYITVFERKNERFTVLKSWKAHWDAPQWSIDGRKQYGWMEHPRQHADVELPMTELLDFMESDEF